MKQVTNRLKVETDEVLIDVSRCSIKIETRGPMMPYDNFSESYNLVAEDFRTDEKQDIASFKHKKNAEAALEKIKKALKKNESYVSIKDCISDDQM